MKLLFLSFCSAVLGLNPEMSDVSELRKFSSINPKLFRAIATQIIPHIIRSGPPARSSAEIGLACANEVVGKLELNMPLAQAALWCSIAQSSQAESFFTLTLNDEGFNRFLAPLQRRMQRKRSIEEISIAPSANPAAACEDDEFENISIDFSDITSISIPPTHSSEFPPIFELTETFIASTDKSILSFRTLFGEHNARKEKRDLVLRFPQGELSQQDLESRNFISLIPQTERIRILEILQGSRTRKTLLTNSKKFNDPRSLWYAQYTVSSMFIPESVLRVLSRVRMGDNVEGIPTPVTAAGILESFTLRDPHYSYITTDLILEWYQVIRNCSQLRFGGPSGEIEFPEYSPKMNFKLEIWKRCLLAPRRQRLESTGSEFLSEVDGN